MDALLPKNMAVPAELTSHEAIAGVMREAAQDPERVSPDLYRPLSQFPTAVPASLAAVLTVFAPATTYDFAVA